MPVDFDNFYYKNWLHFAKKEYLLKVASAIGLGYTTVFSTTQRKLFENVREA